MTPSPEFKLGQRVRVKSLTSMAVQFYKFKIGEEFNVMGVGQGSRGTMLNIRKDDSPPLMKSCLVPADDFEIIDEQYNTSLQVNEKDKQGL